MQLCTDLHYKSALSKLFFISGVLFFITVTLFLAGYIFLNHIGTIMDESSKMYADKVIPAIASNWDTNRIKSEASDEYKSVTTDRESEQLFQMVEKRLGKLVAYHGAQGESRVYIRNLEFDISASYTAIVEFEKGKAHILLQLVRENNKWRIYGFRVNSNVFEQK